MDDFSAWAGRNETVHDTLGPTPLQALTATLDHPAWLPVVGDAVARTSTLVEVTPKTGRSGPLVFVKVRHEVRRHRAAKPALVEFHDIVYRPAKTATLLLDLLRRHAPDAVVTRFHFKAIRPTFDLHPFAIHGKREGQTVKLWAQDHQGWLTMDAVATLKD